MLERAGFSVRAIPADLDECPRPGERAEELVRRLAEEKAAAVAGLATPAEWVVAGDTVVVLAGELLGKPSDDADAARMLRALSGRWHEVLGGWCVRRGDRGLSGLARTRVRFRGLDEREIAEYVASGEPRDKAGAYAIQERGGAFVESVEGSFSNVVGLPLGAVLSAIDAIASERSGDGDPRPS